MYFVGREKETKKIINSLEQGNNIIITGKYGIGRTSLIRHIENMTRDRWRFVFADISNTPGKISQHLLAQLSLDAKGNHRHRHVRYKASRYRVAHPDFAKKRLIIIVLDNIARLTHQKLALIRYLGQEKKFLFIALIESFLPEKDILRLCAELIPVDVLHLSYLDRRSTGEFFQYFSGKYDLGWSDNEISALISATKGYPLGMKEFVYRKLGLCRAGKGIRNDGAERQS